MKTQLKEILEEVRAGSMSVDDALLKIKEQPFADIGYAKVDTHRKIRQGTPDRAGGRHRPLLSAKHSVIWTIILSPVSALSEICRKRTASEKFW